jgi:hypothetical protein
MHKHHHGHRGAAAAAVNASYMSMPACTDHHQAALSTATGRKLCIPAAAQMPSHNPGCCKAAHAQDDHKPAGVLCLLQRVHAGKQCAPCTAHMPW